MIFGMLLGGIFSLLGQMGIIFCINGYLSKWWLIAFIPCFFLGFFLLLNVTRVVEL